MLVVEPVTRHPDTDDRQLGLFSGTNTTGQDRRQTGSDRQAGTGGESNDVDLMHTIAANAVRCGYLLVGAHQRVYARVDAHTEVARVPGYEDDAVHQLLRRHWLTLGASHHLTCGAATLTGVAVLVSRDTRTQLLRWNHHQRPPSWPSPPTSSSPAPTPATNAARGADSSGRVIDLDRHRRRR